MGSPPGWSKKNYALTKDFTSVVSELGVSERLFLERCSGDKWGMMGDETWETRDDIGDRRQE